MRHELIPLVLFGAATMAFGQAETTAVDTLLSEAIARGRHPGLQYVVTGPEGVRYTYAGGLADVATRRAMTARTTMMAYSMTKTFTAVAVLQLAERGRLSVDDRVTRYLPDVPYGGEITIRQLLAHTAGLPNPIPLRWAHPVAEDAGFDADAALARVLARHGKPAAAPGARFAYNNIGYWILGEIVEAVTGTSFRSYLTREVLEPLGLGPEDAGFLIADPTRHSKGYLKRASAMNLLKGLLVDRALIGGREGAWVHLRDHLLDGSAFGGLVATTRAMAVFLQDQLNPTSVLLGETGRKLLYEQQRTTDGAPIPMTLGWHMGVADGETYYYKEGGGGGYHCEMRLYPARGVGSVIMTNETGAGITDLQTAADTVFRG